MLMVRQMREVDSLEAVKEAFEMFDMNGDGFITADELTHMLSKMGAKNERLSPDEVLEIIMEADKNGDGKIDLEEFIVCLTPATRDMPPSARALHA